MNAEDFQRNFARSYFGIKPAWLKAHSSVELPPNTQWVPASGPRYDGSGRMRISYTHPRDDGRGGTYMHTSQAHIPWTTDLDETEVMYAKAPRLGTIQLANGPVFLNRAPHRQYHRGYVPASCHMWDPIGGIIGRMLEPGSSEVAWGVYNSSYTPVQKALDELRKGECLGYALGRYLAVYLSKDYKYPLIWYRHTEVGYIRDGRCYLYPEADDTCAEYVYKICQMGVERTGV